PATLPLDGPALPGTGYRFARPAPRALCSQHTNPARAESTRSSVHTEKRPVSPTNEVSMVFPTVHSFPQGLSTGGVEKFLGGLFAACDHQPDEGSKGRLHQPVDLPQQRIELFEIGVAAQAAPDEQGSF